ncbi:hypothetical protein Tsubulata_051349, partial [Turnera subulata]
NCVFCLLLVGDILCASRESIKKTRKFHAALQVHGIDFLSFLDTKVIKDEKVLHALWVIYFYNYQGNEEILSSLPKVWNVGCFYNYQGFWCRAKRVRAIADSFLAKALSSRKHRHRYCNHAKIRYHLVESFGLIMPSKHVQYTPLLKVHRTHLTLTTLCLSSTILCKQSSS